MVKLKASTIIETIVAMLIITICFGIGVASISGVLMSYNGQNKMKALFIAEKEIKEAIDKKEFYDKKKIASDDYIVDRNISNYKDLPNAKVIRIEVRTKANKLLLTKQQLYISDGR